MTAYLPETSCVVRVKTPVIRSPSFAMRNGKRARSSSDLPTRSISCRSSRATKSFGARMAPSGVRQTWPFSTRASLPAPTPGPPRRRSRLEQTARDWRTSAPDRARPRR